MSEFQGKVVIVTGSSSGIGESIARRLAELGATVVVNSSSSVEAGEAVAKSLPNGAIYVRADISKKEEALNLLDQTIKAFGKLDILVNNVGTNIGFACSWWSLDCNITLIAVKKRCSDIFNGVICCG